MFSRYFEYQVIKRSYLIFKLDNDKKIDYYLFSSLIF